MKTTKPNSSDPTVPIRVFVYGSLKSGKHNNRFLSNQRFIAKARTQPVYRLVSFGSYPGMYEVAEAGRCIHGEVWEVDAACKKELDWLEGVERGHYTAVAANLLPPFDDTVLTYLYAGDPLPWPGI